MMRNKTIGQRSLLGQQGVNLVEKIEPTGMPSI
jgi:hypothetical protein